MTPKWKLTLIVCLISIAVIHFLPRDRRPEEVTLSFQRYSKPFLDPYVENVAFLWLTNASDRTYLLSMTDNTNTFICDTAFGGFKESVSVNCEFKDQISEVWTNWSQQSTFSQRSNYISVSPHFGLVIRVPVLANGQHRKAAVLCESPSKTSSIWGSPLGALVLIALPSAVRGWIIHPKPKLLSIWCDQELAYPQEGSGIHQN